MTHSLIDIMRKPVEVKPKTKVDGRLNNRGYKKLSETDCDWIKANWPSKEITLWIEGQATRFGVSKSSIIKERPIK